MQSRTARTRCLLCVILLGTAFLIELGVVLYGRLESEPTGPCVMSFNIRYNASRDEWSWDFRRPFVVQLILRHTCDLVGVQEATLSQYQYLAQELSPLYGSAYFPRDGKDDEGVPVFYLKRHWGAVGSGNFWLSDTPEEIGSRYPGRLPRVTTWVRLRHRAKNESVIFVNTHLDDGSIEVRMNSSKVIVAELRKLCAKRDERIVLTGDMNAERGSEEIKDLISRGGLRDTEPNKHMGYATFHDWLGTVYGAKYDYILTSGMMECTGFRIERHAVLLPGGATMYPSDHYPIIANLNGLS